MSAPRNRRTVSSRQSTRSEEWGHFVRLERVQERRMFRRALGNRLVITLCNSRVALYLSRRQQSFMLHRIDGVLHPEDVWLQPGRGPFIASPPGHKLFDHAALLELVLLPY